MRIYALRHLDEILSAVTDDCIDWPGRPTSGGYGQVKVDGVKWSSHRFVYTKVHGPIPAGLVVRHSCDRPICVNPRHLTAGTLSQNSQDAVDRHRQHNVQKTHCPKGHPYDELNTYVAPGSGARACRTCRADRQRRWQQANSDRVRGYSRKYRAKRH